jgi:alkylation response protein AidB-like acyl-CoA dehydrogenase
VATFNFHLGELPLEAQKTREEIRDFLNRELGDRSASKRALSWGGFDRDFSRKLGAAGYIGLTWPKKYGGHERTALERYVVLEESLAAGAPTSAHWVADRQSGPLLLRFGTEAQRERFLPRIARGELAFAIGMSEPDSGSDLAAVRTRGVKVAGGWKLSGTKVWTSNAHRTHYKITLARTAPKEEDRHAGMTQFIVDLSKPGITIKPIINLYGGHDFNQVIYDDYFVPDDMVMGEVGAGWRMVTGELAYERSGPDRFLSTYQLLLESMRAIGAKPDDRSANEIGRFVAHLATLRRMSTSIAGMLEKGAQPIVEAALVKEIGTTFEREVPEMFRQLLPTEPTLGRGGSYAELLGITMLRAPSFTIRGGTREILRGMIAKGLGLR